MNEEIIEEGSKLKAALLAGLMAISGLNSAAYAKAKNPQLNREQKIEQICKEMPKEITIEQFKEFMEKYLEVFGEKPDSKNYVAYLSSARDQLAKYGISQKGVHKNKDGGYSMYSDSVNESCFNY